MYARLANGFSEVKAKAKDVDQDLQSCSWNSA